MRARFVEKHLSQKKLYLGNIYAKRDWGHAQDYVLAMWKILQYKKPDDWVISTGKQYSVKQFINLVAKKIKLKIFWKGKGLNEKAYSETNEPIVEIKKRYFRPAEVDNLKGNSQKAKKILKWKPSKDINDLIHDMTEYELNEISNEK